MVLNGSGHVECFTASITAFAAENAFLSAVA